MVKKMMAKMQKKLEMQRHQYEEELERQRRQCQEILERFGRERVKCQALERQNMESTRLLHGTEEKLFEQKRFHDDETTELSLQVEVLSAVKQQLNNRIGELESECQSLRLSCE